MNHIKILNCLFCVRKQIQNHYLIILLSSLFNSPTHLWLTWQTGKTLYTYNPACQGSSSIQIKNITSISCGYCMYTFNYHSSSILKGIENILKLVNIHISIHLNIALDCLSLLFKILKMKNRNRLQILKRTFPSSDHFYKKATITYSR